MRFFLFPLYSLGHCAHGAGHRQQVVAAEVDLCQRGNVADGQRELAEVIVGQVEAPQAGKSESGREGAKGVRGERGPEPG